MTLQLNSAPLSPNAWERDTMRTFYVDPQEPGVPKACDQFLEWIKLLEPAAKKLPGEYE